MAVSAQIEVIRPGSGKKRFFSESGDLTTDLNNALSAAEDSSTSGEIDGVVILNPGDYTGLGSVDAIPEDVAVVIMPGALVNYADQFRYPNDFSHTGEPTRDSNHPLNEEGTVNRYEDFSGSIENIADLNLASDWGFETDIEELRSVVEGEIQDGQFFWDIESGDIGGSPQTRFDSSISVVSTNTSTARRIRFEDTIGNKFNLTEGDIDNDGDDEITVRVENDGVLSVSAGRLLQLGNGGASSGNVLVFHKDVAFDEEGFDEQTQNPNNGFRVLQSVNINQSEPPAENPTFDGHVTGINSIDIIGGNNVTISSNGDEFEINAEQQQIDPGVTSIEALEDEGVLVNGGQGNQETGDVTVAHGFTGGGFDLGNGDLATTDADFGHVQDIASVGLPGATSLEVDNRTLQHNVTVNDLGGSGFVSTLELDDNGHVTEIEFSSANGGSSPTVDDLTFNQSDSRLELTLTDSTTFDPQINQKFLYDSLSNERVEAGQSVAPRNRTGAKINGDLAVSNLITDTNDKFRLDEFGLRLLSADTDSGSSINFYKNRTDMTNGDRIFSINAFEFDGDNTLSISGDSNSPTGDVIDIQVQDTIFLNAENKVQTFGNVLISGGGFGRFEFDPDESVFKMLDTKGSLLTNQEIRNILAEGTGAMYAYERSSSDIVPVWIAHTSGGGTIQEVFGNIT